MNPISKQYTNSTTPNFSQKDKKYQSKILEKTTNPEQTQKDVGSKQELGDQSLVKNLFIKDSLKIKSKPSMDSFGDTFKNIANYNRPSPKGNASSFNKFSLSDQNVNDQDLIRKSLEDQTNSSLSLKFEVSVGRSIAVHGDNPMIAYRRLQRILTANKVRKILFLKRRYEKPFVKRQREAKEANAWRVKKAVRNKVSMVLRMKGWGF
ncbi:hypothetical protein BB559_001507 [Furculomyces boomerangus]|uniref:Ribosomal protein S21 n=3 Tax=Harpellales TaxID=61421 RepID=A0A2T9Z1S6_9FUNG|nr:hypothetical protein BB559_001507 [Furculomyces boomerangus]PWA01701.1 hypothetical protein BB558_002184 [Smittium angustum]